MKKITVPLLLLFIVTACSKDDDALKVEPVESWELSTASPGLGFDDESNSFEIINTGTVKINYAIVDPNEILQFDGNTGELNANDTVKISYTASDKALYSRSGFQDALFP